MSESEYKHSYAVTNREQLQLTATTRSAAELGSKVIATLKTIKIINTYY